jgi:hypothetical protein
MIKTASTPGWSGYFSSPARANAAYGREVESWWVEGMVGLILQAVRGENLFGRPRRPEPIQDDPTYGQIVGYALDPEHEFDVTFQRWLGRRQK